MTEQDKISLSFFYKTHFLRKNKSCQYITEYMVSFRNKQNVMLYTKKDEQKM